MAKRIALAACLAVLAACGAPQSPPQSSPEAAAPAQAEATQNDIFVDYARVRPPAGGQTIAAGFMRLHGGAADDRLISASSPVASSIELHTMRNDGGMMRMDRIEGLDVPAGGVVDLAPGGDHLMLFGFTAAADAATVPITLVFEKAGAVPTEFEIDASASKSSGH